MAVFRRKASTRLIPVNPDNAASKDWVILLEAGTIVGPSPDKLRVAKSTLEKKIVKRYDLLLERSTSSMWKAMIRVFTQYTSVLSFTNQGEEIGRLIAHALASGVKDRRPWYEPAEKLPDQPIINTSKDEFETLVVEIPSARDATGKKPLAVVESQD